MQSKGWEDRTTVKKGNVGQDLVDEYLRSKGIVPYAPVAEGAHPFDRLCASSDKKKLFIAEVKTKARRNAYPDTGINIKHYQEYAEIARNHSISVWLFFVDEWLGAIYGNTLEELGKAREATHGPRTLRYPMTVGQVIYFPMIAMRDVCKLNEDAITTLRQLGTRTYDYSVQN